MAGCPCLRRAATPAPASAGDGRAAEDTTMRKTTLAFALALTLVPAAASAQSFEKKNYNYSEWTKGRFSEAVTVALPGAKMIFLAGVGAEDEGPTAGVIRHLGDFTGQCRYAYDKIKRILEKHGASLADTGNIAPYPTATPFPPHTPHSPPPP